MRGGRVAVPEAGEGGAVFSGEEWGPPVTPAPIPWRVEGGLLAAVGAAGLLGAWVALSWMLGSRTLPDPVAVGRLLWLDTRSGSLPYHVGVTMARVLLASAAALAGGGTLGIAAGLSPRADAVLAPWIVAGLAVPRLVIIVVAYLLVGLNEAAAVLATALAVAPSVAVAVKEGIHAMDWGLVDMARAFRVPPGRRWRYVVWPQLVPYVAGCVRNALSLSLKMVVFAELMGRSSGLGYQIAFYFQMFNMGQILAYGCAAVIVAALLELALRVAERRVHRWRSAG